MPDDMPVLGTDCRQDLHVQLDPRVLLTGRDPNAGVLSNSLTGFRRGLRRRKVAQLGDLCYIC